MTPGQPNAVSAYKEFGADAFSANKIDDRISGTDESADGYFSAYALLYIPERRELQVTVRMNDSTKERLELEETPYFYLNIYEDSKDVGNFRKPSYTEDDHRLMYTYRRIVFENVDIGETNDILVCLSTTGDTSSNVSQLVIHFKEQTMTPYDLSSKEKNILEGE